jgi:hypothetical protein
MAGVVRLPVPVLHHQHLEATKTPSEVLTALDAGLRPQPEDLEAATLELERLPSRDRRNVLAIYGRVIAKRAQRSAGASARKEHADV